MLPKKKSKHEIIYTVLLQLGTSWPYKKRTSWAHLLAHSINCPHLSILSSFSFCTNANNITPAGGAQEKRDKISDEREREERTRSRPTKEGGGGE
jgi:hypothetical protein